MYVLLFVTSAFISSQFERFLPHDTAVVATVFSPIVFSPVPVLVFRQTPLGKFNILYYFLLVL